MLMLIFYESLCLWKVNMKVNVKVNMKVNMKVESNIMAISAPALIGTLHISLESPSLRLETL